MLRKKRALLWALAHPYWLHSDRDFRVGSHQSDGPARTVGVQRRRGYSYAIRALTQFLAGRDAGGCGRNKQETHSACRRSAKWLLRRAFASQFSLFPLQCVRTNPIEENSVRWRLPIGKVEGCKQFKMADEQQALNELQNASCAVPCFTRLVASHCRSASLRSTLPNQKILVQTLVDRARC